VADLVCADSVRITVHANNPDDRGSATDSLRWRRADWVVSPQVFHSRIDLEAMHGHQEQAAGRFVDEVLADLRLT
jgi:hypothetical protein